MMDGWKPCELCWEFYTKAKCFKCNKYVCYTCRTTGPICLKCGDAAVQKARQEGDDAATE